MNREPARISIPVRQNQYLSWADDEGQHSTAPHANPELRGELAEVASARGIVVICHARGTPRPAIDYMVAIEARQAGFSTLLLDLLTEREASLDARKAAFRFDTELLAGRLVDVTDWLRAQPATAAAPVSYFGTGYVASAAVLAAAERTQRVGGVVACDAVETPMSQALLTAKLPTLRLECPIDATLTSEAAAAAARKAAEWLATMS